MDAQFAANGTSGTGATLVDALRILEQNELVSLALDTPPYMAKTTCRVQFLGRSCIFPTALCEVARLSKAPVVPFFSFRDKDRIWRRRIVVGEPIAMNGKPEKDLQACVDQLSAAILAQPGLWLGWPTLRHFWDNSDPSIQHPG